MENALVGESGEISAVATVPIDANGTSLIGAFDKLAVNINGGVMAGRFHYDVFSADHDGAVEVQAELVSVSQTRPDTYPSFAPTPRVALADLPQLIRQR